MKKLIAIVAITAFMTACSDSATKTETVITDSAKTDSLQRDSLVQRIPDTLKIPMNKAKVLVDSAQNKMENAADKIKEGADKMKK